MEDSNLYNSYFINERRVGHYSNMEQILLVGEGDFSFSASLARAFGSATNMVCTSLDSQEKLLTFYHNAHQNLCLLKQLGATVIHNMDAKAIEHHVLIKGRRFDKIVYNFPHAGFFGKEDSAQVIGKHVELVDGFLKSARNLLSHMGEIHISHKLGDPYDRWNIVQLAISNGLAMVGADDFNAGDYPGYINRRGSGDKMHETFPLGRCLTYKFAWRYLSEMLPMLSASLFPNSHDSYSNK